MNPEGVGVAVGKGTVFVAAAHGLRTKRVSERVEPVN
jgi:hypothetical protein